MIIPEDEYPAQRGEKVTIRTGNNTISSDLWSAVQVSPGQTMGHIVLQATDGTVSVGGLNRKHGFAFSWLEPTDQPTGEVVNSLSLGGHQVAEGLFELWPMAQSALTPERSDDDAIVG